jgi:hypothetical protein
MLLSHTLGQFKAGVSTKLVHIGFEVFTAVTMKSVAFWDVTPYGSCKYRRLGGTDRRVMMEAIRSSETPALTRATRCNIPKDIL